MVQTACCVGARRDREAARPQRRRGVQVRSSRAPHSVLLDGQHRCAAAVKTGVPFTAIVVRGLPDEVFDTLDVGPSRSLGQVLSERGERSGFALAAALHKLWLYDEGTPTLHTRRGSHAELIQVLETNPNLRDSVHLCVSKGRDIVPGSAGAVTHYLAAKLDASKAEEFVIGLGEGANLSKESPVLALRELLRRNQGNQRKRLGEVDKWAVTIKAMNAYLEGRSVRQLVWRHGSNEPFPRLLGMQESSRSAGSPGRVSNPSRHASLEVGDDEHPAPVPRARGAERVDAAFELAPG